MSRAPRLTGSDLIAALGRGGFSVLRVKGSHHFLRHDDGRSTVVPAHSGETIGPGLLHKILRDCQLTTEGLAELLQKR
jgi:predicted RNA binding protein YcfA (HicA-like mRNA interferase family)